MDWRQKIENQRGAVLATELKNNAAKLARWTSAALVAGVDLIKLGYVARVHPRDKHHHVILSTQVRTHVSPVANRPQILSTCFLNIITWDSLDARCSIAEGRLQLKH